ncbi:MAG: transglycosylase domain-containing protein [Candidatus Saccharimonadales bacterium]
MIFKRSARRLRSAGRRSSSLRAHRTLGGRWTASQAAKGRKLERMKSLPKSRLKRWAWRFNLGHMKEYWFSREGGIMALKVAGVSIFVFFVLTLAVFAYFRKFLPNLHDISGDRLGGSISYYDRTGETLLWQDYNTIKRVPVEGDQISQYIKDATVAVEDRDFFKHRGFDAKAIMRAAFQNIFGGGGTQGGSTITQQLVKLNQDFGQKRNIILKVKELILAIELERTYTKEEILTGYLNTAPYGGLDYGVQVAASDYFHTSAKDLTLAQSAMLAAIPRAPSFYSPYNQEFFNEEALIGRMHYILDVMADTKKITKEEAEAAKKVDILAQVQPQQTQFAGIKHPYFVLAAKNELTKKIEEEKTAEVGAWKVITTLDAKLQDLAEEQVNKGLRQVRNQGGDVAAFVAQDIKTGQMVALVGGSDFTNPEYGQINYARQPLPPGSSFKPYDYVSLIENSTNAGAGSVLYDVKQPLPGYPCTNPARPKDGGNCLADYDFRFPGPLPLRYALGGSRNVPAVKAILINGVEKTISTAEAMGLRSGYKCYAAGTDVANATASDEEPCYASAGIGDGAYLRLDEHVNGFATISRLGTYLKQTYILEIKESNGKSRYKWRQPEKEPEKKQVVRPDSAYIVADMMSDPRASYMSIKPHRYSGWNFGVKTGTTAEGKDGWMMGFSTKYAAGVWVGYHSRQKVLSGFMENMTRPIWQGWMNGAHSGEKAVNWTRPSSVQVLPAYVVRSHVGTSTIEPSPANDLYPAWYKPKTGAVAKSSTIDKVSGKLATSCTPSLARQTAAGSSAAENFSIDTFFGTAGGAQNSATASSTDDVHKCSDSRPVITLTVSDNGNGTYTVTGTASAGTHPLSPGSIKLSVGGTEIKTCSTSGSATSCTHNYSPSASGSQTVSAQVIDSVLYDSTDSKTVNFTTAASPPSNLQASSAGGTTNFSWLGGSGTVTIYNKTSSAVICSGSGSCSVPNANAPPGTVVYAQDGSGQKSNDAVVS